MNTLKRIARAEVNSVVIEDLQVFLANAGDSVDMMEVDVIGRPKRTLEQIGASTDLVTLMAKTPPDVTVWDENGYQLIGDDVGRESNIFSLEGSGVNQVGSLTDRNNISDSIRVQGMLVYVVLEDEYYRLNSPLTNDDWEVFQSASAEAIVSDSEPTNLKVGTIWVDTS